MQKTELKLSKKVWADPKYFVSFGFGSGLSPIAPGTIGALAGIPIYLLICGTSPLIYCLLTLFAFILGVFLCEKITKELGAQDYPGIVWDEIVGLLITFFLLRQSFATIISGFLLFRLFDIWKPWPIGWVDSHVQGGLGIMLDDVLAAIPAWAILIILQWTGCL